MSGLKRFVALIDAINLAIGRVVMWLAVVMAVVQLAVVILRYVFAIGFIGMQQSVWYMHGLLFMLGAGFALMVDGHVRVDVFYREASPRQKAWTDLFGVVVLLLPLCVLAVTLSWNYVLNSWRVLEGSTEVSGIPAIFLLKTTIWVFAVLLGLQALALAARAILFLSGATPVYSPAREAADSGAGA